MKKGHVALFLFLLMTMVLGCQENTLKWSKEQVCVRFDGKESCLPSGKSGLRLLLKDGQPMLVAMETEKFAGELSYPQYRAPQEIAGTSLSVAVENGKLTLSDGKQRFVDETGLGMILSGSEDKMQLMVPEKVAIGAIPYRFDRAGVLQGSNPPVRKIVFLKSNSSTSYMALTRIEYLVGGGGAGQYIPNDTGTEVIIVDNFKVEGSCDAEMPDNCCPAGEATGGPLDITDWIDAYSDAGQRLLACFPPGSICTYTSGDKLIVVVCESMERYCLNLSLCSVTITTTDGQGICISVPSDCAIENPFE